MRKLAAVLLAAIAAPAHAAITAVPVSGLSVPRASFGAAASVSAARSALSVSAGRSLLAAAPVAAAAPLTAASVKAEAGPVALRSLERISAPASVDGVRAFDGAKPVDIAADGLPFSAPQTDPSTGWYDRYTRQRETQASKIKKALTLALETQLGGAIKGALKENTLYRVDNKPGRWYLESAVKTQGDDPEKAREKTPLVVFNHNALAQLSPEFLAAKLAGMWARHLYRDTIPASAEKTYIEGSVATRVFMALTDSTADNWNGALDYAVGNTFHFYQHFYHWVQGLSLSNVRQGPYFANKIVQAEGDPVIDADPRGRQTLYSRARSGQISDAAAADAQTRFDGFVSNER
jgi:hypothetical protein